MKNRLIKITLTLTMLLVMAVPTQAFAAEKCDTQLNLTKNNNYSTIYNQLKDQFSKAGISFQSPQQAKQPVQIKQTPTTAPAAPAQTKQAPTAAPAAPAQTKQAPTATPAKQAAAAPASANIGAYEQQVVDLVNKERAAAGLSALKVNTKLAGVAEKKAEDLRDNNYFDHQSPTYGSPFDMMKQFGITYTAAGENIAKGQKTPSDVMNGWMNSPGHRANILNADYTEIGVGYVTDSNGTTYWVQHFIRP
jgi:uncharacterized YkwD family protein